MGEFSIGEQEILNRVYKGPAKTGDNVDGLVTLGYIWDGSNWVRDTGSSGAITIADGSDTTLGSKTDAKSTATDATPVTLMQVAKQISASVQAPPSQAVTNIGTFAVQTTGTVTSNIGTTNGLALDATLTNGNQQIQGNIASAATDSGNPVKIGGKYAATKPTLTDGQRGDLQVGTRGSLSVQLYNVDSGNAEMFLADNANAVAVSATANKMAVVARDTVFNGTTWDLAPGDATNGAWVNIKAGSINALLNPSGTILNTFSIHLTSNTTTTPTASLAYISSIAISNEVGGTTSNITIQDKSATPLKLVNGVATTALTTAPSIMNFQTPIKMIGGIDIITAGVAAATVDVWINYYQ